MNISIQTRWAPTCYKSGCQPYKWPYEWVITLLVKITTSFITGFWPILRLDVHLDPRWTWCQKFKKFNRQNQHFAVEISSSSQLNSTAFPQHLGAEKTLEDLLFSPGFHFSGAFAVRFQAGVPFFLQSLYPDLKALVHSCQYQSLVALLCPIFLT